MLKKTRTGMAAGHVAVWGNPRGEAEDGQSLPAGGSASRVIRRSRQEVSLDPEEHRDDVLILDVVDRVRTTAGRRQQARALERRVEMRPQDFETDIEVGMRVPLRPRTELGPAVVRVAVRHAARHADGRSEGAVVGHSPRGGTEANRESRGTHPTRA